MSDAGRAAFILGGSMNFAETATLSGGDWESNLPLTNLQHPDIDTIARTVSAAEADTQIKFALGSARPIGGFAVGPSNPTPGSTWTVQGFSGVDFTTEVVNSGTLTVPGTTDDSLDYEWEDAEFWFGLDTSTIIFPFVHSWIIPDANLAAAATARSWWIKFFDESNADGYRDFGWLAASRCWRPSVNYSPSDNSFTFEKIGDQSEAISGKRSHWDRGLRRVWRANFGMLEQDEGFDDVGRMMRVLHNSRQYFVSPDPTDTTHLRDRSFIATFRAIPSIALSNVELAATAFECEEVM
jgi:hypothetical protein